MIHTVARPDDRRELDSFVRKVYDEYSTCGDTMSRREYDLLIQGGANALHRFQWIVVPRLRPGLTEPHIIETEDR